MTAHICYITNLEDYYTGMKRALDICENKEIQSRWDLHLIDDKEPWSAQWEQICLSSALIYVSWMGTGLSGALLKELSAFCIAHSIPYIVDSMDPNGDQLTNLVKDEDVVLGKTYFASSGLENYKRFASWVSAHWLGVSVTVLPPKSYPWRGIYHPSSAEAYDTLSAYQQDHWVEGRPTVAFVFARETWLWQSMTYETEVVKALEKHGCNVIAFFTTTTANETTGAVSLRSTIDEYCYKEGRCIADVLINPFVFSLTITHMLNMEDIQDIGIPIIQVYNVYKDFAWWEKNTVGLTPNEVAYAVALPEFDGVIHGVPVSTNEEAADGTHYRKPLVSRIDKLARMAKRWATLTRTPNKDKKVAIVFHNFPSDNSGIGSAAHLESMESVRRLLLRLQEEGYEVPYVPASAQELADMVTSHTTNDRAYMSDALMEGAEAYVTKDTYAPFFDALPMDVQEHLLSDWGDTPGNLFRLEDKVVLPGFTIGNILITIQPPRGFGDNPDAIYHDPYLSPSHHYLAMYHWVRDVWKANAMVHIGTHGNLEWLPGKGNAMSDSCFADIATGDLPNIYPYWITCVGEGMQAKRRSAACLISYLSAPMSLAGAYDEYEELEKLLEEYCHFANDEEAASTCQVLEGMIQEAAEACHFEEIQVDMYDVFSDYVAALHMAITDLKNMQISVGLHVLGQAPEGEAFIDFLILMTRVDNPNVPSVMNTLARAYGYEYEWLMEHSAVLLEQEGMTAGMLVDKLVAQLRGTLEVLQQQCFSVKAIPAAVSQYVSQGGSDKAVPALTDALTYICEQVAPRLLETTLEIENLVRGLEGHYVDAGPSGAPTAGGMDLLPTGKNFYTMDPRALPTKAAWEIGKQLGDEVIARYISEEGKYPESAGIILWATSNLRNHGQCMAEFLYLMGLRPVWQQSTGRVTGVEVIPLEELKRPRIDVMGRISGLFRDSLPGSVIALDQAASLVASLDEPITLNFVRKHALADVEELVKEGCDEKQAWRQATFRIFGDPPGIHGAGIGEALGTKQWDTLDDLATVYTRWGAHAYGDQVEGDYVPRVFQKTVQRIDMTIQNVDNRESSMLSGDDYNNYRGGLVAAVRVYKGSAPRDYVGDTSDRAHVKTRSLKEELTRWHRGEAMNPKFIEGMKAHDYKGAGDLATYVDISFQWDVTSDVLDDWMYEGYANKYALDPDIQSWMRDVNPWALHRLTGTLLEAIQRGYWDASDEMKDELQSLYREIEGDIEDRSDSV